MRTCKQCNQTKLLTEFYKTGKYPRHICKKCENRQLQNWRKTRSQKMKLRAVEYLGGKCCICGYYKCTAALEFAHQDEKNHEPSRMFQSGMSWNKIKSELDKCLLKCANCHREETFG